MKTILVILLFVLPRIGFSQDLDCKKFKTGYFQNIDSDGGNTFIKRKKKYQIETDTSTGAEIKLKITWINDCSYKLSLISGNSKWDEQEQLPNNPDLIVVIIETGKDYYIQVANFEGLDGIEYRSKIKLIK
jgi:hypothetical protein